MRLVPCFTRLLGWGETPCVSLHASRISAAKCFERVDGPVCLAYCLGPDIVLAGSVLRAARRLEHCIRSRPVTADGLSGTHAQQQRTRVQTEAARVTRGDAM